MSKMLCSHAARATKPAPIPMLTKMVKNGSLFSIASRPAARRALHDCPYSFCGVIASLSRRGGKKPADATTSVGRSGISFLPAFAHGPGQLRQLGEDGHAPPPLLVIEGRRSADHGSRGNVTMRP